MCSLLECRWTGPHIWSFQWNGIDIFAYCRGENKDILLALWRVWFPRDLVSPSPLLLILFLGRILSALKTFCSVEFCIAYPWQLHSHLWSWMRSLVHILFYLCLWSDFLWFFFSRLCFYSKDSHPTIFKEETKVTFTLSIWHCLPRHMDKWDRLYTSLFLLPVSESLWFRAVTTAHNWIDGNAFDPTRLLGFAILLLHLS